MPKPDMIEIPIELCEFTDDGKLRLERRLAEHLVMGSPYVVKESSLAVLVRERRTRGGASTPVDTQVLKTPDPRLGVVVHGVPSNGLPSLQLAELRTARCIPSTVPCMLLRADDPHAAAGVEAYYRSARDHGTADDVDYAGERFLAFTNSPHTPIVPHLSTQDAAALAAHQRAVCEALASEGSHNGRRLAMTAEYEPGGQAVLLESRPEPIGDAVPPGLAGVILDIRETREYLEGLQSSAGGQPSEGGA